MITTPESRHKALTLARDRAIAKIARYEKVVADSKELLRSIQEKLNEP